MSFFDIIWNVSFILAFASIAILLLLVVRRLIIQYFDRRRDARRAVLQDKLYNYLGDPGEPGFAKPLSISDQRILLDLVVEMMRSVTGDMRDQLIGLLEKTIDQQRIARTLQGSSPQDRAKFAARLFWSRSPAVHTALRAALDDKEPAVVLAAANALISSNQPLSLVDLVPRFEAREMLGHRAVRDIFRKVAPQNSAILLALLDEKNPAVVVLAVDALARIPSPPALKRLAFVGRNHASVDVRASALRTIGLVGDLGMRSVVTDALTDSAWEVRAQAAIAAGRMRLPEALDVLNALLRGSNWWVQLRAAQALAKLGDAGTRILEDVRLDMHLGSIADFALSERHGA